MTDRQALRAEKLHRQADRLARKMRLDEASAKRDKAVKAEAKAARRGR